MSETENQKSKSSVGKRMVVAIILILVTGVVLFFGQYFSTTLEGKVREVGLQEKQISDQVQSLETKTNQLQQELQDLRHEVAQLKINTVDAAGWNFSIIEHLVNLAQLTLNTGGDTKMIEALLISAKRYASDPLLKQISQALDQDLNKLKTMGHVDIAVILPRLAEVRTQIDKLSLPRADEADELLVNKLAATVQKGQDTRWQRFVASVLNGLRQLLVIRYETTIPVLSRAQEDSLHLYLQTKVLQIELAVLQKDHSLYNKYLDEIIALVKRYFALHTSAVDELISQFQELKDLSFGMSDSYSLESMMAVKKFISQRHGDRGTK